MSLSDRCAALQAVLFVASEPVTTATLARVLQCDVEDLPPVIDELRAALEHTGLRLVRIAGGWQMSTHPDFAAVIGRYLAPTNTRLSRAALETVAIIAYRQPVTLAEVEAIRGVSCDGVIKTLLQRRLIEERGRKPVPGRPMLYGTTDQFLHYFGLEDLSELPEVEGAPEEVSS